jgi:glycosyltransferase involved in cell wall biosynthesis
MMTMKLTYLSCEAPMVGSASHTHIHEIIKGFEKRGWDVKLYYPSYADQQTKPNLFLRLLECLRIQLRLCMEWRKGSVIYVRAHYLAFPTSVMAKICGIPIFHEINGPYEDTLVTYPPLRKIKFILLPIQRVQYKLATGLITVTEELMGWAIEQSKNKNTIWISNAANTDLFNRKKALQKDLSKNYAIFFGSLTKWHGLNIMLDAISTEEWPSDVKLVIIGDGGAREQVIDVAKNNSNLLYLGKLSQKELPAYIVGALCGLVISDYTEDTGLRPLKLFEMMACGIPIIATDYPGQADIIRDNEAGVIIPRQDAQALARAVSYLASNPEIARDMGARGHDVVHTHHSWDQKAGETEDFILKTMGKK